MGTYVGDKYIKGMMNSTGCSVEEAIASTNKDPNNTFNTGIPDNDYIEEALDLQFKKKHEAYKNRNLRFYKLLGQNYESLVNGILRGKDIVYPIPKRYEMNTKHPFVLDWLLLYGRPAQIASVRQMGPVKLNAIYNALLVWCEQNPSEAKNWVYEKEWRDYFADTVTKRKSTGEYNVDFRKCSGVSHYKSSKIEKEGQKIKDAPTNKEEHTMEVKEMLPELQFYTRKKAYSLTRDECKDIFFTITNKKCNNSTYTVLNINLHPSGLEKINSDYIVIAPFKNRLYIKPTTAAEGYKLTSKVKTKYTQITLTKDMVTALTPFASKGFVLQYDDLYELYFVEVEE